MKKLHIDEKGIGIINIGLLIAIIGIVGFTGGYVLSNQRDAQNAASRQSAEEAAEQARLKEIEQKKLAEAEAEKDAKTVDTTTKTEAAAAPTPKPTPPPPAAKPTPPPPTSTTEKKTETTVTKFTIESTSVTVGDENVTFSATLPSTYSGLCQVMVKWSDGTNDKYFKEHIDNKNTCVITVPKSTFDGRSEWKFYMYYYNDSYTVKGVSSGKSFTL